MRRDVMRRDLMLQSPRLIKRDGGIGVGAIAGQRLSKVGALGVGASSSRHRLKTAGVGRMRRGQTPTSGAASGTGGLTEPQASEKFDDAIRPKRPSRALGRATGWNVARDPHDGAVSTLHPVANWYRLLVSNAWQADQILQELQSVRVTVGASLRARHFGTELGTSIINDNACYR